MIIRNQFNGYGRDGIRLYFDPATILAMSQAATAAAPTVAAAAAPTIATTTAAEIAAAEAAKAAAAEAAKAAALEGGKVAATEAGKTAALEASKQGIIQNAMQQQAAQTATQQGLGQAAAQQGVNQIGAANLTAQAPNAGVMTDAGFQSAAPQILPPKPGMSVADAEALNAQIAQFQNANPNLVSGVPSSPFTPAGQANVATSSGMPSNFAQTNAFAPNVTPSTNFTPANISDADIAAKTAQRFAESEAAAMNPLEKGIQTGMNLVKKYPLETGAALMVAGQYLNQPKPYEHTPYSGTVNMSEFRPSSPSVRPYKPVAYAIGGPVEQMAAQNAVGANTGYPMAGINTSMYSNPMIQRPEAVNVLAPSSDAGVGAYSGEPKFKEGGISEATAKEYGLKTRKQRAARGLMDTYEGMEKERAKTMSEVEALGRKFDVGTVPRSRTQQLSGAYPAAQKEFESVSKRYKIPVAEVPKTSLGDMDSYLNTPVEAAAKGGIMGDLGSYSDGGRLLRGPGDGVSDSIPAVIGKRQPARLADGEFVIPARIVSELGNGSTEAGARKLYAMMERIQNTRKKSIGKKKVAVNSRADKHLPA